MLDNPKRLDDERRLKEVNQKSNKKYIFMRRNLLSLCESLKQLKGRNAEIAHHESAWQLNIMRLNHKKISYVKRVLNVNQPEERERSTVTSTVNTQSEFIWSWRFCYEPVMSFCKLVETRSGRSCETYETHSYVILERSKPEKDVENVKTIKKIQIHVSYDIVNTCN